MGGSAGLGRGRKGSSSCGLDTPLDPGQGLPFAGGSLQPASGQAQIIQPPPTSIRRRLIMASEANLGTPTNGGNFPTFQSRSPFSH